MRRSTALSLAFPWLFLAPVMLHTATMIAVPKENETTPLKGLVYKARFEAAVTSVRLAPKSEAGVDPLVADWVFTGSNSDGQVHRVEVQVRLLDEAGRQIGWYQRKTPIAAGAHDQTFSIPMKVKLDVWKKTTQLRILADWIT